MTVGTALAVSWNPLMNSNPNATARATAKKIWFGSGSPAKASHRDVPTPDLHSPLEAGGGARPDLCARRFLAVRGVQPPVKTPSPALLRRSSQDRPTNEQRPRSE